MPEEHPSAMNPADRILNYVRGFCLHSSLLSPVCSLTRMLLPTYAAPRVAVIPPVHQCHPSIPSAASAAL